MEYLKEAAMEYPYYKLYIELRSWGVIASLRLECGLADKCFSWNELEQSRINPITNWVECIEGSL